MPNGLSNHDSGQGSRDNDPHAATALLEDEDIDEEEVDEGVNDDESFDLDLSDDVDESQDLSDDTLELAGPELIAEEAEMFDVTTPSHPIRAIEAHWEAKRLDAMLREVYDEE